MDRERAIWFAKRFESQGHPYVGEAMIPSCAVLSYLTGRKEDEILVQPDTFTPGVTTLIEE